jgi:ATP synthase protein I
MSSRTENGDAWWQPDDRPADRGPGSAPSPALLPAWPHAASRGQRWRGVIPGGRPAGRAEPGQPDSPAEENQGWSVFSYLISGMAVYGAIGWLIGRWTHVALIFPVGMLTGLALAIVLIIYRYGRS